MAKTTKPCKWRSLEFWAEDGAIVVFDNRDGGVAIQTCGQFMQRVLSIQVQEMTAMQRGGNVYSDEVAELRKFLEEATWTVKKAKAMGDRTDPKVMEHRVKHRTKNRILVPDMGPTMKDLPGIGKSGHQVGTKAANKQMLDKAVKNSQKIKDILV